MRKIMMAGALLAAGAAGAIPVHAQVASGSVAALGLADNYTAGARGFNAVAWNPAALGLPDNPSFSLVLLALRGGNGLGPIGLSDLADWSDRVVPDAVKEDWLSRIVREGSQRGEGEVEATWAAVQTGRVALHASTRVRALTDLSPGIAELVMFGNAAPEGARELDLSGSWVGARAFSTLGASIGVPIDVEAGVLSLGATLSWTVGHVLATGAESTGQSTADPVALSLEFPLVQTSLDSIRFNGGNGFGLDVGASFQTGAWTIAAVARNLAHSFSWNLDHLQYRPLRLDIGEEEAESQTEAQPLRTAPADVIEGARSIGFDPAWSFGAAYRPDARLLVSADARFARDDGMLASPVAHVGGGVELYVTPWLPLRAGAAYVALREGDRGYQLGAGLGILTGAWGVNAAIARRDSELVGASTSLMISVAAIGVF
jgi:hypothetical protein